MYDTMQLLGPTAETPSTRRERHPPPPEFEGITLGLLDIGKARRSTFLDRLEMHFTKRGLAVKRVESAENTETVKVVCANAGGDENEPKMRSPD